MSAAKSIVISTTHLFLFVGALLFYSNAFAQPYQFTEGAMIKGLPSTETYEIYQSRDGFLWIASDEGVIRYDGFESIIFNSTKGLPDPVVFSFYEDADSAIWFRSLSGKTSFIKNGQISLYKHSKKLEELVENNFLHSIVREGNRLHFGTGSFVGHIEDTGEVVKETMQSKTIMIRSVNDQNLVFGMLGFSTQIDKIDFDHKIYPIKLSDTLTYNKVIRATRIKSDVFVSINSNIFKINGTTCTKFFTGRGPIISLKLDGEQKLWVGYLNIGADRLDIKDGEIVNKQSLFDSKSITSTIRDDEGGMWVTTLESGVYYIENPGYKFTPLPFKPTVSLFNNNRLFIGDQSGTLTIYRYPDLTPVWTMKSLQPLRSLFIDREQNLWAASDRTNVIDLESKIIKQYFFNSFSSFEEDSAYVWATGGARINKFALSKNYTRFYSLPSIHSLILPMDNNLLVSKRLGLDLYSKDGELQTSIAALEDQKISKLISLNTTSVAIGTIGGGLFLLDKKTLECKKISSDFNTNYIYSMAVHDSSLYLSTEKGVVIAYLKSMQAKDSAYFFKEAQKVFSDKKLQSLHIVDNAILGINDDGIISIPFSEWIHPGNQPRFYYELISEPMKSVSENNLTFDFNKPLKIKFGYISFKNQSILSRYRLAPNSPWVEITNREIDLNAIAPGDHQLELQSSLDGKNWINRLRLNIQILPPWWKSWYSIAGLILFTISLSILIVQIRIKRLKEKEVLLNVIDEQRKKLIQSELETIERERTRIAKDLHDSVGTDLAAIKLSVHQLIEQSDPEMAKEINTYFQDTIQEIRFIIQDLAPPGIIDFGLKSSLQNYIDKVVAKFKMKVNFDWQGEEFKDSQRGTIIFRTIQELVTNTIKHSKGQEIALTIESLHDSLIIHYSDNGVGFEMSNNFDGLGLKNIKSRVEFLNGTLLFDSKTNSTSFEIKIPH